MENLRTKRVESAKVISIRHAGAHDEIGKVYHELHEWAQQRNLAVAGPGVTVFLGRPRASAPESAVFEVCLPVAGEVTGEGEVVVKELPACTAAYTTVKGPYRDVPAHYSEMLAWMSAQGMEPAGEPREVYLKHPDAEGKGDPAEFMTEIQFPIEP